MTLAEPPRRSAPPPSEREALSTSRRCAQPAGARISLSLVSSLLCGPTNMQQSEPITRPSQRTGAPVHTILRRQVVDHPLNVGARRRAGKALERPCIRSFLSLIEVRRSVGRALIWSSLEMSGP